MFDPGLVDLVMALRSRGVSDADVLRAVEQSPRKAFLPETMRARAYEDASLPIACGQSAVAPFKVATLLQILRAETDSKALLIGAGSGWPASVLARICRRVYAVERYKTLIAEADRVLRAGGQFNVELRHGDGRYGWPGQAPFDRIVLFCGVRALPEKVLEQLAPGGRLVASVDGHLTLVEKARTKLTETTLFPLDLPMIEAGKSRTL